MKQSIWKSTAALIFLAAALIAALFLFLLPTFASASFEGGGGSRPPCNASTEGWYWNLYSPPGLEWCHSGNWIRVL